jgi:hypothetical protein
MPSAGAGPRFEVRIGDEVLTGDLARCTPAARAAIEPLLATVREEGVPLSWLRRCEEEGQDGTGLAAASSSTFLRRPASGARSLLATTRPAGRPWC